MRKLYLGLALVIAVTLMSPGRSVTGEKNRGNFKARLSGFEEVPAISTTGQGEFTGKLNEDGNMLSYELSYSNLTGATVSAAHIHIGQRSVNGGVMAFLCGGGNKPACPVSGTVTGNIVASDVTAVASQGIAAGEFAEMLRAIRSGNSYVNVHTNLYPGGEIRGQIRGHRRHDDDDD
ncbi:MAG: CHRD domain-containing protein [Acidobacteria bacterium]|nr:CHRD domain-containing protein [Acidobacteriota bacterium]MCI0626977.1 CHRD domain-containing protein [Acidobacteriota bacterium]MCI0717843.1 CHRD domain-containing protein [Acidobacteriota bacterium]